MHTTRPSPPGWPRLSPSLVYRDAVRAIDWLVSAFGFAVRMKVPDDAGGIRHSELSFGEAVIMVASEQPHAALQCRSPKSLNGTSTQALFIYVDDIEAHHAQARAAGAAVLRELATTDYGADHWIDRGYTVSDPEGHIWHFAQRLGRSAAG